MKKDAILFISIFCVLALISGGTYAYWMWQSDTNKSVIFNTSKSIEEYIIYDEGESHFVGDFQPSTNYCGGMSNTLSFSINTANANEEELAQLNKGILVNTIYMDVNSIQSNISASDSVHWVLVAGDSNVCSGYVATGTFKGVKSGDTITLLTDEVITTSTKTFTVWIWIDSAGSNLSSLSGETIDVNVWSQVDMLDVSEDRT